MVSVIKGKQDLLDSDPPTGTTNMLKKLLFESCTRCS